MSKRKGLSHEEKRQAMLSILHDSKDVFVLKDLEKLGSKRGVVLQTIKEVLQSLVDDDLVHLEKIGISNYYWSFPSEAAVKLDSQIEKLERQLRDKQAEKAALRKQVEQSRVGKEDSEERRELAQQLAQLQAAVGEQKEQLAAYAENDPERYDNLKENCKLAVDAANRWMDNIDALRGWLKKRFDGMASAIDDLFKENGIKEDFEYLQLEKLEQQA